MKIKKKKLPNEEIDLSRVINDLLNNKLKIFLIMVITVIIAISSKTTSKVTKESTIFLAKTEILPISVFDEHEYSAFNTYLINRDNNYLMKVAEILEEKTNTNYNNYFIKNNTFLKPFNKDYLYKLFVEKLNQKKLFRQGVKELNFIKKENYSDIKKYEDEITKLVNSIRITQNPETNFLQIVFKVKNKKIWEDFLNNVEKTANLEIQYYLKNNFELFMINANRLLKYKIEDITFEIENNLENKKFAEKLKKLKRRIEENRDLERLRDLFENTPINISKDFFAAKFDTQLSEFETKKVQDNSLKTTILMSIFLGLILGTIYIIIENKIKRSR